MRSSGENPGEQAPDNPQGLQHPTTAASSMLAATRMPQLPRSTTGDGGNVYDPFRYGEHASPPPPPEKRPPVGGAPERLPSVMELLNPQVRPAVPSSIQPPHDAAFAAPYQSRPSTQGGRYDLPSPSARTTGEGQMRPGHFAAGYWEGERDGHRPTSQPVQQTRLPDPTASVGHPAPPAAVTSPRQAGSAFGMAQPMPPAYGRWHPSQSPQSVASSAAPSVTSLTTVQKERPQGSKKLLGEREIPGEGRVFVYDDGTKIPTTVDGEPVNGQWGMTKAGRPRKRMPQACVPCRQKKIKCDPRDGKCVQCEKSGKECQYSTGHRGQKSSPTSPRMPGPTTPAATVDDRPTSSPRTAGPSMAAGFARRRSRSNEGFGGHKRFASHDDASTQNPPSSKRVRTDHGWQPSERVSEGLPGDQTWQRGSAQRPRVSEDLVGYGCWATGAVPEGFVMDDPFITEPSKAERYLQSHLQRINNGTFCVFPRETFAEWARNARPKSRGELMVLYAILANGALFPIEADNDAPQDCERYLRLARTAIETAPVRQGLEMVLAKIVISHIYIVRADVPTLIEVNDVGRAVGLLKYDLKERLKRPDPSGRYIFGMTKDGVEELYRRAEWVAFLADRFISIGLNHPLSIRKEDLFLRLPCDEADYDKQLPTNAPYFDNGIISRSLTNPSVHHTRLSPWSYLLQGASFASDIWTAALRSEWQDREHYPGNCDAFTREMTYTLNRWYESLPHRIKLSTDDAVNASVQDGSIALYIAINALYHLGHMSLNRRVRASLLPHSSVELRVRAAIEHAEQFLRKIKLTRARLTDARRAMGGQGPWFTPVPFVRQTVLGAVDILTSCGQISNMDDCNKTIDLCESGMATIEQMAMLYESIRPHYERMVNRLGALRRVLFAAPGDASQARAWMCEGPIDLDLPKRIDAFYTESGGVNEVVLRVKQVDRRTMKLETVEQAEEPQGFSWDPVKVGGALGKD